MQPKSPIFILSSIFFVFSSSCSETKFRGATKTKRPSIECKKRDKFQGIDLLIVSDMSNSQKDNDCPDPVAIGVYPGSSQQQFSCGSAPQKELAINSAFDFLATYRDENDSFESRVALATFPSIKQKNIDGGYDIHTAGDEVAHWQNVATEGKATFNAASTAASRHPFGRTPYIAGLSAGIDLFSEVGEDGLLKLMLFLTDGFPTDTDHVVAKGTADELRNPDQFKDSPLKHGVERVITVFVTNNVEREGMVQNHFQFLTGPRNEGGMEQSEDNANGLLGLAGSEGDSLIDRFTDEKIEKGNHGEIESVFTHQIQRAVECED